MKDVCALTGGLLSVDGALAAIKQAIGSVTGSEKLDLKNALGRVLAAPVFAAIHLPSDRNSAMDGYAFASSDIQPEQSFALRVIGTSWAGRPFTAPLKAGECVRIFTGAVVPAQADSVIMQEQVTENDGLITFPAKCRSLQNVREIGEDVKQGELLLHAHKKLSAVDLGLLAAAGIAEVDVVRKVRVSFFSTGDELIPLGQRLATGQIYDSNRYILHGLLTDVCFEVTDGGVIADDKAELHQALQTMAKTADVIITTGGASVGNADFVQDVLAECGKVDFWKIAMKPGKPLAFGSIENAVFFGLPGNPIAVFATFDKFVKPALQQLAGEQPMNQLQLTAVCASRLKKTLGRQDYQRGILKQTASGKLIVESAGRQGSNILSSSSRANCFIVLPSECNGVEVGDEVQVEPFGCCI